MYIRADLCGSSFHGCRAGATTSSDGTPTPIVTQLNNEIKAILATDEVKQQFLKDAVEVDHLGPPEFEKFLERETANWTRVVKKANIKLED